MECLICGDPISHARLGVNACRPCAAFYKRNSALSAQLECKGGDNACREREMKTQCRKCRLTRFREVLAKAGENAPIVCNSKATYDHLLDEPPSEFIDHTSLYDDCEPSTSETPLLQRVRKGYSLMCLVRNTAEHLASCSALPLHVRRESLVPVRASYSSIVPNARICQEAIIEFGNYAFPDFRVLDQLRKKKIAEASFCALSFLDSTYRSRHYFPEEIDIRMGGYSCFVRTSELEAFFDECPESIDKDSVVREYTKAFDQCTELGRLQYDRVNPTNVEFLAIFALALWNDDVALLGEELQQLATRNRAAIMADLNRYYKARGVADYASRVGNLFCVLANFQKLADQAHEDYHVYALMNLYTEVSSSGE